MHESEALWFLWFEGANIVNYLINRYPTCINLEVTPKIQYSKLILKVVHIRI